MGTILRKQLTLFLDEKYSEEIEKIRDLYNPIQVNLIKSHVTLCRQDEIEDISTIVQNIKRLKEKQMKIEFERISKFSDGNDILISASENNLEYHNLRNKILENSNIKIRFPEPHITLMHPRNSKCTDEIFEEIKNIDFPKSIVFDKISLIEQENGGKWKTLITFPL